MTNDKYATAPHVVIVGGGFGGLYAARALGRSDLRVTIIDRNNYHLFQPLLYQVATAALSVGDIAQPIRSILNKYRNVSTMMAEVTAIDLNAKSVETSVGPLAYDYLIIAAGATSTYFGHDDWEPLAPTLKTVNDAFEIRRHILSAFESAELEKDEVKRHELLTFVIIGAGPTGVELAGTIAEIARQTLKHDFRVIDPTQAQVILLQSSPEVLPEYPDDLSASAERQLKRLGVDVRTNSRVTGITPDSVQVGDTVIPAKTAIWTAGVAPSPLAETLGIPLDKSGRVPVAADLTIAGHPEAYVIGDLALFTQDGAPLPGIAPVAIQQGSAAAANICRTMRGEARAPFRYHDRGMMATIGRAAAVGKIKGKHLSGFPAWIAWLAVHLYFLIGFDNRAIVLFSWFWSYATGQRNARLITGALHRDASGAFTPDAPRTAL
ncbi:MAG TPA: NAD(P)/FAD-dependent oxidoreductase [Abditibacteriaceae bacterium]|nr:NAD(P)/FAD-dependent oxidoreductase [Abditibacteriaceae bacterium]